MSSDRYDYARREREFAATLADLPGRLLEGFRVHVVAPEFNVAFLGFADDALQIAPAIGGELLQASWVPMLPPLGDDGSGTLVIDLPQAAPFIGRTLADVRIIGRTWQGHGVELAFAGIVNRTLLVTSVECPEMPTDIADALRIGVAHYLNEWDP